MSLIMPGGGYTRNPVSTKTGGPTGAFGQQGQDWNWSNPYQAPSSGQQQAGGNQGSQSQAIDMSQYAPGRARAIPEQSQGTPFQAYVPKQGYQSPPFQAYAPQQGPNGGAMTPSGEWWYSQSPQQGYQQPPPFTQSATGINGQQFSDPSQAFAQRDAMIQRINEARGPMFAGAGTYQGNGAPPADWGQKPPLDFNALMGQANGMVANGWQNPFADDNRLLRDQVQQFRPGLAQPVQPPPQGNRLGEPGPEPIADPRIARRTGQLASAPDERADPAYYAPPSQQAQVPSGPTEPDWNSVIQKYRAADGVLRHGYDSTNPAHVQALQDRKAAAELMSQGRDKRDQKQEQDRLALPRDEYLNRYVAGGASAQRKREAEALAKAKQFSPWRKPFVPPWQEQNPSGPVQNDGFNQWLDRTPGYVRDDANLPALRELYRYQQDPLAALRNAGFRI